MSYNGTCESNNTCIVGTLMCSIYNEDNINIKKNTIRYIPFSVYVGYFLCQFQQIN